MATIKKEDVKKILESEITTDLVYEYFGSLGGNPPKYKLTDKAIIPPKGFEGVNRNKIETTGGILLINRLIISPVAHFTGYLKDGIPNKGAYGELNRELSYAYSEDKISRDEFIAFCQNVNRTMNFYSAFCSSNTYKCMKKLPKTMKRKKELLKKYEKELAENDPIIGSEIEEELVELAKEELGDDVGLDIYRSGAKGSFDNNFKNMNIMIGPIFDPNSETGFTVITKSYSEGFDKSDLPAQANLIVDGAYSRGIATQTGGKMVKDWYAKYQTAILGEEDSDCGTTNTIKIKITRNNKLDFLYSYILESGKNVLLDLDNINSYIGKTVNMRDPMFCNNEKYCSKCAGKFYFKTGYERVGLTLVRAVSNIMNANLKKTHNVKVSVYDIDIEDLYK